MIGELVATLAGSAWARAALRHGVIAIAILLFLLTLRRSGERAGRLAERLQTTEKANDVQRQRLVVLGLATSLLSGCATVGSEPGIATVCPPVVEYSREFQARAAEELARLPHGSAIAEMLSDYAVIRDQVRMCSRP